MRATLESQSESARQKADYEKVIRTFRAVYRADPAYSKTPLALGAVAELYQEMGRRFSNDGYFFSSIEAYQFLLAEYPQHSLCRGALFSIGEIYRSDLENPEEARKAFQQLLEKYPKSAKASEAQEKLEEIDQISAERAARRSPPRRLTGENLRNNHTAEVTAIRRWVGPNYTRIVISVEEEVKFDASRIANPDRIVFDLSNTRLSPALVGKNFPVEDGFLHQIRVAQYRPAITRVVLDVERIEDYSVFSLPNPFRLVIDIHGGPTVAASLLMSRPLGSQGPPPAPAQTLQGAARNPKPSAPPGPIVTTQESSPRTPVPELGAGEPAVTRKAAAEVKRPSIERESQAKETASVNPPSLPSLGPAPPTPAVSTPPGNGVSITPAAPTESGARTLTRALGLKIGRIVVDPGHGGHDTGTIGPTGLSEKDLVLDVALRLKKLIDRNKESDVILTRSDDNFIPLEERTAIANEKAADLFISIHANASHDRSARGIETYYLNFTSSPEALEVAARENATSQESVHELQDLIKKIAMTEKVEESHEFANQIQHEVHARLAKAAVAQRDRGVKKAPFVVLIGANMPSVLAEISFLTNPRDERALKRPEHRQKIAQALYEGILRYVNTLGGAKVAQQADAQRSSPPVVSNF